jgi:dephospho-CoA kinase
MMDFTLLISAPEEMRIARVVQRDGTSEGQVRQRMAKQWPDAEKQRLASKILMNDNTRLLIPQIIEIDENLKEYGKIW